jgi:hypothetical protein
LDFFIKFATIIAGVLIKRVIIMNNLTRNSIAVIIGLVIGAIVNIGFVTVGPSIIPPPAGVDMTTPEGLKQSMALLAPKNFIFPFLAHAMGTLVGAFVAAKLAVSHSLKCAMIIGFMFLLGGISMVYMVGGPMWFIAVDLILAYLPMAYIGWLIAGKKGS